MGTCFSCGTPVGGILGHFTCPACKGNSLLRGIRSDIQGHHHDDESAIDIIASGLNQLTDKVSRVSDELSALGSVVEWGFEELKWELQQQTHILTSIDNTLKTPSQTQAKEWRAMAEQLRSRGCLDEAAEWFVKSLSLNPLDFRTYIGLAMTHLRKNDFDKAENVLTKSIPHAPVGGLEEECVKDFKSVSYRLIGRIWACREDYTKAAAALRTAVELSPDYPAGNYAYAQYCILSGDACKWGESLRRAISSRPGYWYMARVERNFRPVRQEVTLLLSQMLRDVHKSAAQAIAEAEPSLAEAKRATSFLPAGGLGDAGIYKRLAEVVDSLACAKSDLETRDYRHLLKAHTNAIRITKSSEAIVREAAKLSVTLTQNRQERQKRAREELLSCLGPGIGWGVILAIVGGMSCCCFPVPHAPMDMSRAWGTFCGRGFVGFILGVSGGVLYGIWAYIQTMKGK